jgi:signal transduction histidine kinase
MRRTQYNEIESRVLILAPTGNDASVTVRLLQDAGILATNCNDFLRLTGEMQNGCAAVILAEETLGPKSIKLLMDTLDQQPSWSDTPVIIITTESNASSFLNKRLTLLGPAGNITLLERPFRPLTIVNAVQVAVRSRRRQYQVRDLMAERQRLLTNLEANVEERTAELRQTNSQLEELVYSIAHDLRAPLRAMQGFSKLLMDTYANVLDETGREFALRIMSAAERMDAMTLDLLSYGRMSRSEVTLAPVSVERVWNAAVSQCEQLIAETDAEVSTISPLPTVLAEEPILTQILANLLNNGLKFVHDGERPRIIFRTEEANNRVTIWVEDNGIGIPEPYKERVFRVFERLDGSRYKGTGIGLSIVRKGIERMGGAVGVESEPGNGSRFWINLAKAN